ncbi:hypothetical protein P154DRAFT_569157 [Amniculicola lignicola CBS 123094]|uniref:Uncharacterized protein n=1 Tax=Amniculicola lignicola CBS 123094 TaxID=1392246 RepID=A0A6A5WZT2_9PLEO|nr:hypothetical protein P154DRAFT_569157 [Amniculicola lignicola CBS 123094]
MQFVSSLVSMLAMAATSQVAEQPPVASVTIFVTQRTTITATATITSLPLGPTTGSYTDISSIPRATPPPAASPYAFGFEPRTINEHLAPSGTINELVTVLTNALPAFEQWLNAPLYITRLHLLGFFLGISLVASFIVFRRDEFNRVYSNGVFEHFMKRFTANAYLYWTLFFYILHVLSGSKLPLDPLHVFAHRLFELNTQYPCWSTKLLQFIPEQFEAHDRQIHSFFALLWREIQEPLADTGLVCLKYFGKMMAFLPLITEFLLTAFSTTISWTIFLLTLMLHGVWFLCLIAQHAVCGFWTNVVITVYRCLRLFFGRFYPAELMLQLACYKASFIKAYDERQLWLDAANMSLDGRMGLEVRVRSLESVMYAYKLDEMVAFERGMVFKKEKCIPYEEWAVLSKEEEEEEIRAFAY